MKGGLIVVVVVVALIAVAAGGGDECSMRETCADLGHPCDAKFTGCYRGYCNGTLCVPAGQYGDSCVNNVNGACISPYFCDSTTHVCTNQSSGGGGIVYGYLDPGETCSPSVNCSYLLFPENGTHVNECVNGVCRFQPDGGACDARYQYQQCNSITSYCNPFSKTCAPLIPKGQECYVNSSTLCESGLECAPYNTTSATGLCASGFSTPEGHACLYWDMCQEGNYCSYEDNYETLPPWGLCKKVNTTSPTLGMVCTSDDNCTIINDETCQCNTTAGAFYCLPPGPVYYGYQKAWDAADDCVLQQCGSDYLYSNLTCTLQYCGVQACIAGRMEANIEPEDYDDCESQLLFTFCPPIPFLPVAATSSTGTSATGGSGPATATGPGTATANGAATGGVTGDATGATGGSSTSGPTTGSSNGMSAMEVVCPMLIVLAAVLSL